MFTLYEDWRIRDGDVLAESQSMLAAHHRYGAYLEENRARFPVSAFEYASAPWRNNFSDHRAPHDAWVVGIHFNDRSLPAAGEERATDLELVLLGAYHDGHLHLMYRGVRSFRLSSERADTSPTEVYRDEVRLSDRGLVLHEIEFLGRDNWLIECGDIEFEWRPRSPP
jgi:hypothetical protein